MARIACPHDDELTAYLVGDLPTVRQDEIAEHVETCTLCKPMLDQQWKSAKDDLTMALRNSAKTDKPETYAAEPELQQVTAMLELILNSRRTPSRGPRESPLPPGLHPGDRARETAAVPFDQPDVKRSTSPILDFENDGVQKTQSVHIPRVDDRTTTAPLERLEDENRFTLSLKQPLVKRWQELQDMPPSNRWGVYLGLLAAVVAIAGIVAAIVFYR